MEIGRHGLGPGQSKYYGPYIGDVIFFRSFTIVEQNCWKIEEELMKLVKQRKEFKLDFSKYEDQAVGLPYNISFVVRKNQKR